MARGLKLLEKKAEEGEKVLFKLLETKRHRKNHYLAMHVGGRLYSAGRKGVLLQIMDRICSAGPAEPSKYNLYGLALVDSEPRKAIVEFKNALRCDLNFGPAYLNLADAYAKIKDTQAADLCLDRYLKVNPNGPFTTEARQRIAVLELSSGN